VALWLDDGMSLDPGSPGAGKQEKTFFDKNFTILKQQSFTYSVPVWKRMDFHPWHFWDGYPY
jgi:hypothetical protein